MKSYKYVDGKFEYKYEIKHSVFIVTIKNVEDENDALNFIKEIKKKYSDATHNCYAYIADEKGTVVRFSDDGEPSGTAGQPILEVLKKQKLFKTAVVVTRYFGGIKLGANGLIGAYTTSVVECLKTVNINEKIECKKCKIQLNYSNFSVFNSFSSNLNIGISNINYGDDVTIEFYIPVDDVDKVVLKINEVFSGLISIEFEETLCFYSIK